ncbi:MAG: SH3 domain-containing protein [Saprospiraceae bacterium]
MKKLTIIIVALMFGFAACKNDPASKPAQPTTPAVVKDFYAVTVNDLRLRTEPNGNAAVLTQLSEGAIVESLGEVSAQKEEVELRGRLWLEPYYLVMAPNKQKGWLYGGGLLRVYSGDGKQVPNNSVLEDFSKKLAALDVKQVESGKTASSIAQAAFSNADVPTADAGSLLLENFWKRMLFEGELYRYTENAKWEDMKLVNSLYEGTFDMNTFPETKQLAEGGFLLMAAEGSVFPEVDYRKLSALFSGKLSPSLQAYYDQTARETDKPVWDDGGLILPLPEIADRAAWWERFNKDNPAFVQREAARFNAAYLIHSVTNGGDNTPIFDYEKEEIEPEFRAVWKSVQQKYPGTRLADMCGRMEKTCQAANWKLTPEVEAELEKVTKELMPD